MEYTKLNLIMDSTGRILETVFLQVTQNSITINEKLQPENCHLQPYSAA